MAGFRALICALTLAACASAPEPPSLHAPASEVHADTISHIEARISMPRGAQPLEAYDRYYAVERIDDRNIVKGVFLLRSAFGDVDRAGLEPLTDRAHVYRGAAANMPAVADGGCAVVTTYFDTQSSHFLQLEADPRDHLTAPAVCNGEA